MSIKETQLRMFQTISTASNTAAKNSRSLSSSQKPTPRAALQMVLCQFKPQRPGVISELLTPVEILNHLPQRQQKRQHSTPRNRHSKVLNLCGSFYIPKHVHTPRTSNSFALNQSRSTLRSKKTLELSGSASNHSISFDSGRNKTIDFGSSQRLKTNISTRPAPLIRMRNEHIYQRRSNSIATEPVKPSMLKIGTPRNQNRTPVRALRVERSSENKGVPPASSILKTTSFSRNKEFLLKPPNQTQAITRKMNLQARSQSNPRSKNVTFTPSASRNLLSANRSFA